MKRLFFSLLLVGQVLFIAQQSSAQDENSFRQFHIYSSHTSFPDTGRRLGHVYSGKLYSAKEHYNDSTVLIIAPKNLNAKKKVDLVFWFHGCIPREDSVALVNSRTVSDARFTIELIDGDGPLYPSSKRVELDDEQSVECCRI